MTTSARMHQFAGFVALCGVLQVGAERIEAQGDSEASVKKQIAEDPMVNVSTPEGSAVLGEPCCSIVRIDIRSGIITVREKATGYTFRVEVKDKKHLAALKVGDKVWADFAARKVRLEVAGITPCCSILDAPAPPR